MRPLLALVLVLMPVVARPQTFDSEIRLASAEPQASPAASPDPRRSGRWRNRSAA